MLPFYGILVVKYKYQYNVNIADEVEFNQKIAVVPVAVRYKNSPLRLPCSGFTVPCCVPGVRVYVEYRIICDSGGKARRFGGSRE